MSRNAKKAAFLKKAGWGDAVLSPLAGDASNRRYERIASGLKARAAVLMDAPAERGEDISIFLAFTGALRALGYSAPEVLEADIAEGFAIIEDLGDALFARVAENRLDLEATIYEAAVDLLAAFHAEPPPNLAQGSGVSLTIPPYDIQVLKREARLAMEWWASGALGKAPEEDLLTEYDQLLDDVCAVVATDRSALVMRDYHSENLLWLPERCGHRRVGLLDYQDALLGAPAYDLVSLLEDARRDTSSELRDAMFTRYLSRSGEEPEAFQAAYALSLIHI